MKRESSSRIWNGVLDMTGYLVMYGINGEDRCLVMATSAQDAVNKARNIHGDIEVQGVYKLVSDWE